jgi:hypothetical protein
MLAGILHARQECHFAIARNIRAAKVQQLERIALCGAIADSCNATQAPFW